MNPSERTTQGCRRRRPPTPLSVVPAGWCLQTGAASSSRHSGGTRQRSPSRAPHSRADPAGQSSQEVGCRAAGRSVAVVRRSSAWAVPRCVAYFLPSNTGSDGDPLAEQVGDRVVSCPLGAASRHSARELRRRSERACSEFAWVRGGRSTSRVPGGRGACSTGWVGQPVPSRTRCDPGSAAGVAIGRPAGVWW